MLSAVRRDTDILVVGGGPAGLATAHAAALAGASVQIVHRDEHIGLPVRTSGGSWALHLRELGIPQHLQHPIRSAIFASRSVMAEARFGVDHPVSLDITGTYRYLADLATQAGADLQTRARFISTEPVGDSEGSLAIDLRDGSHAGKSRGRWKSTILVGGEHHTVTSRFIVDASGSARAVTSSLGLQPRAVRYGVGAEYECKDLSPDRNRCVLFVGSKYCPAGYGWALPTMAGTVRIGIGVLQPDTDARPKPMMDEFLASDLPRQLGIVPGKVIERHFGVLPSETPNERAVFGNIVCVGDTAMQALPLIGEGIRYCIEAGRFVGKHLADAVKDPAHSERILSHYESWWKRRYAREFWLAWKMNVRIAKFSDEQWDMVTRAMQSISPDSLAQGLRAEITPAHFARFLIRRPSLAIKLTAHLLGMSRSGG